MNDAAITTSLRRRSRRRNDEAELEAAKPVPIGTR
jgi:hypothetical protein